MAKHSPELAQSVVDCGALEALVICLEEFDPGVKEAAAWALGYVARHNGGILLAYTVYAHPIWHFIRFSSGCSGCRSGASISSFHTRTRNCFEEDCCFSSE